MLNNNEELTLQEIFNDPSQVKNYNWGSLQILKTNRKNPYSEKEKEEHYYIDEAGELEIWLSDELDFRRKTDCLYLPYDKWLILLCRYADHPDKVNELIEIAKEIFPNCKKVTIKRESLRNADMSNQDKYTISDWLEQSNLSIKEFINNPAYIIFISYNRIFEDLITSGLLNVNFIEDYCDSFSFDE